MAIVMTALAPRTFGKEGVVAELPFLVIVVEFIGDKMQITHCCMHLSQGVFTFFYLPYAAAAAADSPTFG